MPEIPHPTHTACWLVPSEPLLSEIKGIVTQLASKYGGPVFVPHVTIHYGAFHSDDSVEQILETLAAFEIPSLEATGLDFTDVYVKSCFIQFQPDPTLTKMCATVQSLVHFPSDYQINPHMSLFYGRRTPEQRKEISCELVLPASISFDAIIVVANPRKAVRADDFEEWHEIARIRLVTT